MLTDKIDEIALDFDFSRLDQLSTNLFLECSNLIKIKQKDLLSTVDLKSFNEIFTQIFYDLDFSNYNKLVNDFNRDIEVFLDGLVQDTSLSIQARISEIQESNLRFTADVIEDLDSLNTLEELKKENAKQIRELRDQIDEEQNESIEKHKDAINEILYSFNSMIRLKVSIR